VILAIDCGLSFVKVALATADGAIVDSAREPHSTVRGGGRAEQDPEGWLTALAAALARIERRSEATVIVPTGHMHGLVLVDEAGRPVLPCLTLQDLRGAAQIASLDAHGFHVATGQTLDASLPVAKLLWLRDEHPELLRRARTMLAPKDFLGLRLTGARVTDPIDASGYGVYDPRSRAWRPEVAGPGAVDAALLPPVADGVDARGPLAREPARILGLTPGIPVLVGGGDDIELLAATAHSEGRAVEHVGSTGAIVRPTAQPIDALPASIELACTATRDRWSVGASTTNCGSVLEWAHRSLGVDPILALETGLAVSDPLVRARLWPERGSGLDGGLSISAIRPEHTREELARSVALSVASELRRCLARLVSVTGEIEEVVTSGGSAASAWLQLRADIYGRPIRRLTEDPTALGCVALGMVALGTAEEPTDAARRLHREAPPVEPDPTRSELIEALLERTYRDDAGTSLDFGPAVAA
jgi:xylulokinase